MRASNDCFRITIYYREPTYELATGRCGRSYCWTSEVAAADAVTARDEALRQFEELARCSSVGWVRRVERVLTETPSLDRLTA
jgi:hypothetical protein